MRALSESGKPQVLSVRVTPAARQVEIAETVGAIAWELDALTLTLTYVGHSVVEIFGYPVERWLKPGFLGEVVHPDDQSRCVRSILKARDARTGFEIVARMVAADGTTRVTPSTEQLVAAR